MTPLSGSIYRLVFWTGGGKVQMAVSEVTDVVPLTKLNAPVLPSGDNTTVGQITATITDNNSSPNEENTEMQYKESSSGTWLVHGTAAQDATSYVYDNLSNATEYNFRAIAKGAVSSTTKDSDPSATLTVTTASASNILMQDDFNDNTIDSGKWTLNNDEATISEANNRLEINLPHSTGINETVRDDFIISKVNVSSGKIWAQFDYEAPNTTRDTAYVCVGLYQTAAGNRSYCARIIADPLQGKIRFQIWSSNSKVYEVTNVGGFNQTYKIGYDISTHNIELWQLTGVDTWTQIGTTQTYNILQADTIDLAIVPNDNASSNDIDYLYIDNVYISTSDYSTSIPS